MNELGLLLQSHDEETARALLAERYSLSGSQKPFLVLHEGAQDRAAAASTTAPGRARRTGRPNRRQQRKSAAAAQLQRVRARSASGDYTQYLPLNALWNEYLQTVLGRATGPAAAQLVLAADWNGAQVRVVRSKNPAHAALAGILLYESRSQWLFATPRGLRLVPKQGTVVRLEHPAGNFDIVGDRVCYRPAERTTRKFKPHRVDDIAALIDLGGAE